jgi:DNA-binding NtrC family response regulator
VIIISGFGTIPIAIEAVQKGAIDFIEKPLNLDEILNKIEFLKKTVEQEEPIPSLDTSLLRTCNIVGASNLFLELIQQVNRLAPHSFPILIYGEYGTGKTTLAHYIHKKSNLADQVCETINCEAQENCVTTLERMVTKKHPMTIFLKRIDTLDHTQQKTLLSFLEKHPFIRVIASSIQSLFHLMQQERFNSSLFAFLNKAPLEVPSLRKRPYDIPLLVNHYINHDNRNHKKQVILTTHSIRLLRNHTWPGNIHELKQVIENIVIHAPEDHSVITPQHLTPILGEKDIQFIEEQSLFQFDSLDQATTTFKKNFLLYLLKKNHFNIEQVSHRLNLTPIQLKNHLLELNITF